LNASFTEDGGLDYSLEQTIVGAAGGHQQDASQFRASSKGGDSTSRRRSHPLTVAHKRQKPVHISHQKLVRFAMEKSQLSLSHITKNKVEEYATRFIYHLNDMEMGMALSSSARRMLRSPHAKIKALVHFVKDKVPRMDWDLCMRIILDMERYGIFHVKAMAVQNHLVMLAKMQPKELHLENGANVIADTHRRIIIVGAGASGIVAAIRLKQMGYSPLILEARQRLGGRVHSCEGVDAGATIMTAGANSPVYHWCKELKIAMHQIADSGRIYDSSGKLISFRYDLEVQEVFNKLLDKASKMTQHELSQLIDRPIYNIRNVSLGEVMQKLCHNYVKNFQHPEESELILKLFYWHIANLEYGIGTDLGPVGLKGWDLDDRYETKGHHFLIQGGVNQVFKKLAMLHDLDIRYEHQVTHVDYNDDIVRIGCKKTTNYVSNPRTNSEEKNVNHSTFHTDYEAEKVLVTVPLFVLKNQTIDFSPALPNWKTTVIQKMGFGVLNKVILFFEERFWTEGLFYFGQTTSSSEEAVNNKVGSKTFHPYLYWDMTESVGRPCLMSLVPGNSAINIESIPEKEVIETVMERLRSMFPGEKTPKSPSKYFITNWSSDSLSGGCYAFSARDCFGIQEYSVLARDIHKKLFFAGEHTMGHYSATVLGASLSGLREAGKIDLCLSSDEAVERGDGELLSNSEKLESLMRL